MFLTLFVYYSLPIVDMENDMIYPVGKQDRLDKLKDPR